jgi:outer membrane lipoprotein LolB
MRAAADWGRWLIAALTIFAAGCASPPRAAAPAGPWSGRLALQIEGDQRQSFAAGFELRGNAKAGELDLYNPLGGTLALLAWAPGSATLRANDGTRQAPSVDELVAHVTGAAVPVAALFDWLRGIDTPVAGWQSNLSLLGQGRLSATRLQPPPQADLRVVLDR